MNLATYKRGICSRRHSLGDTSMVRGAVLPTTILLMLNMIETWQAFSPLDRLMYLYVYLCVCVGMHAGLFVVSGNFLCSQYVFSAMLCSSVSAFFYTFAPVPLVVTPRGIGGMGKEHPASRLPVFIKACSRRREQSREQDILTRNVKCSTCSLYSLYILSPSLSLSLSLSLALSRALFLSVVSDLE